MIIYNILIVVGIFGTAAESSCTVCLGILMMQNLILQFRASTSPAIQLRVKTCVASTPKKLFDIFLHFRFVSLWCALNSEYLIFWPFSR